MKKILLTGATGFLGSELLKSFALQYDVYIITRHKNLNKNFPKKKIKIISYKTFGELNKKLIRLKLDYVVHCATHYVKQHNFNDLEKLNKSNILFGNVILENLDNMGVKKFINFSTVWENYDAKKENFFNLYAAYKNGFNSIINFYKKRARKTQFYSLVISDTFGEYDVRKKIINTLRINFKKNKVTNIISKNLSLNLLNVKDIEVAVNLILKRKIKPNHYVLKNTKNLLIADIIERVNKISNKKIKVKWLSSKNIKEKIYDYKKLSNWKPTQSRIQDVVNLIKK